MSAPRLLICGGLTVGTLLWFSGSIDEFRAGGSTDYVAGESSTYASLDDATERPVAKSNPFDICILPEYDPWDEEIVQYVNQDYDPLKNCNHKFKPMTTLKNGIVTVNAKNVTCRGRCLTRRSDFANNIGRWVNVDEADFECEIVETLCSNAKGRDVYQMVHAQIIEKNDTKLYKERSRSKNYHNVYVILLDSIASTQGTRNLPQTMHFFEKSMEAVSFPHINKVGLNSRPNGVALWFGKSMEKVDRKLFGLPDIEPDWSYNYFCTRYVDNETFLMREFSERGYKTLLAEDWSRGTLNWPTCKGFKKQPTDHYMRPFQLALEKNVSKLLERTYNKANCIEQHQDILRYLEDFINSYKGIPKFGWIWLSLLGHDHESGVIHADPDFQRFLLHNKKKLDDSFVIILGDHGLRGGRVTHTKLGSLEMNNPMFSISVPKKLRKSTDILSILRENSARLQTHYDIRATLLDILKYQPSSNFTDRSYVAFNGEYGTSLLRTQPSVERTCKNLPIPISYCTCQYPLKQVKR
ncbi:hypothetical protein ANCCAN_05111 [Ancylostoma caninum]|uniref:Arylsulfatase n=1 Tax=Ancylostoma caninum TaxID=29170 RepID=A0A368GZ52_ANCCA|nr:hypothetical protein ANCCAN_05111 [Ancylostoma caninum]